MEQESPLHQLVEVISFQLAGANPWEPALLKLAQQGESWKKVRVCICRTVSPSTRSTGLAPQRAQSPRKAAAFSEIYLPAA